MGENKTTDSRVINLTDKILSDLSALSLDEQNQVIENLVKTIREARASKAKELSNELNLIESSLNILSERLI